MVRDWSLDFPLYVLFLDAAYNKINLILLLVSIDGVKKEEGICCVFDGIDISRHLHHAGTLKNRENLE
jgi:hypothetical protein